METEMESVGFLDNGQVPQNEESVGLNGDDGASAKVGRSLTGSEPVAHDEDSKPAAKKIEKLEIEQDEDDTSDMESLLPSSNGKAQQRQPEPKSYLNGLIRPQRIGNMHILFPEHFHASGWGVLGPHWFGPACVWGILVVATHMCIRKANHLGVISVILCYCFFAASTFFLTDVSLRDPGICLDKEIPETTSQADQWRWCDFCQVYQPPDGAHCPECNVCVAGYDHHCVWMGTCIGKKNYRQFVKFNVSWLWYVGYLFFWLVTFGPLIYSVKK